MSTIAFSVALPRTPNDWRAWLNKSGLYVALFAVAMFLALKWAWTSHPGIYLLEQDTALLLLAAGGLAALARMRFADRALAVPNAGVRWAMIGIAAAFAYYGSHYLLGQFGISRDEQLAEFAAEHLRRGQLGWPVPPHLKPVALAVMPLWADTFLPSGYWVGQYLPVNALIRAGFVALGDGRLAGPVLLVIGAASLWSAARRLWPDQSRGALVALVLLLTSAQVLANAMTAYAMTAHLALNALWLACFLRGDKRGHAAAIAIGFLATGLHQIQFHLLFVGGFILWLIWQRRWQLALLYAGACAAYIGVWFLAYPRMIVSVLGYAPPQVASSVGSKLIERLMRLAGFEPGTSLARFVAWQNLLLAPLFVVGAGQALSAEGRRSPLCALTLSCLIGLATMVFQGHGYGYRYLHHVIPAFCLVAGGGWLALEREQGRPLPAALLWGAAAFTMLVTTPFALWKSQQFDAPYVAAYRAVRAAPADVVLVDKNSGAWVQDIVRIDPAYPRPLLMDLGDVEPDVLTHLCATRRVMVFGDKQARALGMREPIYYNPPNDPTYARQRQLAQLHCGEPVPLP